MATVWAAEDRARRRRVAVKILMQDYASSEEAVERFTLEARAIARIRSPYVPRIYDQGFLPDGTPFTVMELLEGIDLDGYLRVHGALSVRATVRLVLQIASALSEAHRMGIVHRDVKAENIFITGSGDTLDAKLFDFGIAKTPFDTGKRTQMGATMGTPAYMSPEQLMSAKDVDARADLWSLGIVAYLALTDRLPFEGETFGAMCIAIHHGAFALPGRIRADLPPAVDAWVERALSTHPGARFQTAEEMIEALDTIAPLTTELLRTRQAAPEEDRSSVAGVTRSPMSRSGSREPRGGFVLLAAAACVGLLAYGASARTAHAWTPGAMAAGWSMSLGKAADWASGVRARVTTTSESQALDAPARPRLRSDETVRTLTATVSPTATTRAPDPSPADLGRDSVRVPPAGPRTSPERRRPPNPLHARTSPAEPATATIDVPSPSEPARPSLRSRDVRERDAGSPLEAEEPASDDNPY